MLTSQAVPLNSSKVHNMPTTHRKMPSHRHSRIPIGIRSFQDHSPMLTRPSVPASRTTKSSSKHIPSSPTKEQPSPVLTQMSAYHQTGHPVLNKLLCINFNALQDQMSCYSTFIPFQDHFGPTVHFQTFQDQQLLEQLWIYNCYRGISVHISNFFKTIWSTNIEGTIQHLPFMS